MNLLVRDLTHSGNSEHTVLCDKCLADEIKNEPLSLGEYTVPMNDGWCDNCVDDSPITVRPGKKYYD